MMPEPPESKGDEPLPAGTALSPRRPGSPDGVLYGSEIRDVCT
jgi:hypothetical protein